MNLMLTDAALVEVKKFMAEEELPEAGGLRVRVAKSVTSRRSAA